MPRSFDQCRSTIADAIAHEGDATENYGIAYAGPWATFQYAEELKEVMLSRAAVVVNAITQLGILHAGGLDAFERILSRPEAMYSRKQDALARRVSIPVELRDLIDWPLLVWSDKCAGAGMAALTLATAVGGRLTDFNGWLDTVPTLARAANPGWR